MFRRILITHGIIDSSEDKVNLMEIREQYADEYLALTTAEKAAIVKEYNQERRLTTKSYRVSAGSKVQDFQHTYDQLASLVSINVYRYSCLNNSNLDDQPEYSHWGAWLFFPHTRFIAIQYCSSMVLHEFKYARLPQAHRSPWLGLHSHRNSVRSICCCWLLDIM